MRCCLSRGRVAPGGADADASSATGSVEDGPRWIALRAVREGGDAVVAVVPAALREGSARATRRDAAEADAGEDDALLFAPGAPARALPAPAAREAVVTAAGHGSPHIVCHCAAVLGVARIVGGEHLVLATEARRVAGVSAGHVWRVTQLCTVTLRPSPAVCAKDQERLLVMLRSLPSSMRGMLYSRQADIATALQTRRVMRGRLDAGKAPVTPRDPRRHQQKEREAKWSLACAEELISSGERPLVVWNAAMLSAAGAAAAAHAACVRVIVGFAGDALRLRSADGRTELDVELLARTSAARPGTRFHRRGVDGKGSAANFVESEMRVWVRRSIAHADGGGDGTHRRQRLASLVMTRGSAPMVWTQTPWLRYTPFVATAPVERSADYGALHLSRLTAIYGTPLVAVSLISEKGRAAERVIAEGYDKVVAKYKREVAMLRAGGMRAATGSPSSANVGAPEAEEDAVRLVDFDYHQHCKGPKLNAGLAELRELLCGAREEIGWYEEVRAPHGGGGELDHSTSEVREVTRIQHGVFRVNCMDSLDRTNVAQQTLAFAMIEDLCGGVKLDADSETRFRCLWSDHGDRIAQHYAGTKAFKRDVTRYGRRTMGGMLVDVVTASRRYLRALFSDARKQDAMDVFTSYRSDSDGRTGAVASGSGRAATTDDAEDSRASATPAPGTAQSVRSTEKTEASPNAPVTPLTTAGKVAKGMPSFLKRIGRVRPWQPAMAPEMRPLDACRVSYEASGVRSEDQRAENIRKGMARTSSDESILSLSARTTPRDTPRDMQREAQREAP